MPPSSRSRGKNRKQLEVAERSDVDETITTPSRKRRRVNNTNNETPSRPTTAISELPREPPQRRRTKSNDVRVADNSATYSDEEMLNTIRSLRVAKVTVQARTDHANEVHEEIYPTGKQAFAKIAGNGWTFFVEKSPKVRIGRPPDERAESSSNNETVTHGTFEDDPNLVHIDLGPSKHVSRQHAEIFYDETSCKWFIHVIGRNGIKLDECPIAQGNSAELRCGNVIEVSGTQMMFFLPNTAPTIHPAILAQIRAVNDDNDDEEDDPDQFQRPSRSEYSQGYTMSSRMASRQSDQSSKGGPLSQNYGNMRYAPHDKHQGLNQNDGSGDLLDMRNPNSLSSSKMSPTYSRGMMLETTEDIDYSHDSAKDLKPPYSYAQLIGMAIMSSPEEKLTLAKIYDYIKERYAFYRYSGGGWQNSIRHNLSLSKSFEKIARRTDEPGKGMKWQIVADFRDEFLKKGFSSAKKGGQDSSGPSSPLRDGPSSSVMNKSFLDKSDPVKAKHELGGFSPGSTSPIGSYTKMQQSRTPELNKKFFTAMPGPDTSPRDATTGELSPYPESVYGRRTKGLNEAAVVGTPGGPALLGSNDSHDQLITPLISRQMPKLAPPSTAHLPSQFMPMSSPAPFWKYAAEFQSSPAKGQASSPIKGEKSSDISEENDRESDDQRPPKHVNAGAPGVESSSPPPLARELAEGSPTGDRKIRGDETQSPSQSKFKSEAKDETFLQPLHANQFSTARHLPQTEEDDDEDGEEGGLIDLARGFQPIGSFHAIRGN